MGFGLSFINFINECKSGTLCMPTLSITEVAFVTTLDNVFDLNDLYLIIMLHEIV